MKRLMVCAIALGVTLSGGIALAAPGDPDPGFGSAGVVTGGLLDTYGAADGRFVGPDRRRGHDRRAGGDRPLHRGGSTRHELLRRWSRRARADRRSTSRSSTCARSLTARRWWPACTGPTRRSVQPRSGSRPRCRRPAPSTVATARGGVTTAFGGYIFLHPDGAIAPDGSITIAIPGERRQCVRRVQCRWCRIRRLPVSGHRHVAPGRVRRLLRLRGAGRRPPCRDTRDPRRDSDRSPAPRSSRESSSRRRPSERTPSTGR